MLIQGFQGFPGGSDSEEAGLPRWLSGKESVCNAGNVTLIPGLGRYPGGGNGNPLCYPCLGNPRDRGAWQAAVHGVAKSWTRLSTHTCMTGLPNSDSAPTACSGTGMGVGPILGELAPV